VAELKFGEVALLTGDVIGLANFYKSVLNIENNDDGDDVIQFLITEGTGLTIYNDGIKRKGNHRNICIAFTVDDVDAEFEKVKSLGANIAEPPTDRPWGARNMSFYDPDGNLVIFRSIPERQEDGVFLDTDDLRTDEIFLKIEKTVGANPAKRWVPCYMFKICLSCDGTEIGECNFRIGYTEKLYFVGHIGYKVYERFRGSHYAGKACLLLFELARRHGMRYLYIACNPENHASRKTCEYAGAVLEAIINLPEDNERYINGERQTCIYRVNL